MFDYPADLPLDLQEHAATHHQHATVYDLSYASPKGGRVPAYLVVPIARGPFAAVLLQHGMPSWRGSLLEYALDLAPTGTVSLLIDAPFARPAQRYRVRGPITFTRQDRDEQVQLVVDLRRGIDLLTSRSDVEPHRMAYIGRSFGATIGGLLSGVETRIRTYILAVGNAGLVAHFTGPHAQSADLQRLPKAQRDEWLALMTPLEPLGYICRAAPASLLFQAARHDTHVAVAEAVQLQQAGSEPKRVIWYDADHHLNAQALYDQVAWLQEQIGIRAEHFQLTHDPRERTFSTDVMADVQAFIRHAQQSGK
jgi:cephalosporin-C deacetylase-like acetyl esterase